MSPFLPSPPLQWFRALEDHAIAWTIWSDECEAVGHLDLAEAARCLASVFLPPLPAQIQRVVPTFGRKGWPCPLYTKFLIRICREVLDNHPERHAYRVIQ